MGQEQNSLKRRSIPDEVTAPAVQKAVKLTAPTQQPATPAAVAAPKTRAATKCIYFNDGEQLKRLEAVATRFPKSSVSSLVQQLVEELLKATDKMGKNERCVKLDATIWL
jgi:hypothetical protein